MKVETSIKSPSAVSLEKLKVGDLAVVVKSYDNLRNGQTIIKTYGRVVYLNDGAWDYDTEMETFVLPLKSGESVTLTVE